VKCVRSTPATHRLFFQRRLLVPRCTPVPYKPHGVREFPCPTLGNPLWCVELVGVEPSRLPDPSLDRTSDSPSPSPRAGRLPSRLTRSGASLRSRSRLVPVRFRVVVPYFPSPESLSPSFGSSSLRELPPSARRSSSSVPKVLGVRPPGASCQFLQCSRPTGKPRGSSIPSLPFGSSGVIGPEGPTTAGSFSSRPIPALDFRAPARRPQPFRRRWDGPRIDHSRAPFVGPGLPRGQRSSSLPAGSQAPLLSIPRRGPPSSGRVPSTIAKAEVFHGLRPVPSPALLEIASEGRHLFIPAWAGDLFDVPPDLRGLD